MAAGLPEREHLVVRGATVLTMDARIGDLTAADVELRATALRAMGYAWGWAQVPYLVQVAAGPRDDDAHLARYAKAARTREGFQRYLDEYVWNRTPRKNSSPAASRA